MVRTQKYKYNGKELGPTNAWISMIVAHNSKPYFTDGGNSITFE